MNPFKKKFYYYLNRRVHNINSYEGRATLLAFFIILSTQYASTKIKRKLNLANLHLLLPYFNLQTWEKKHSIYNECGFKAP